MKTVPLQLPITIQGRFPYQLTATFLGVKVEAVECRSDVPWNKLIEIVARCWQARCQDANIRNVDQLFDLPVEVAMLLDEFVSRVDVDPDDTH